MAVHPVSPRRLPLPLYHYLYILDRQRRCAKIMHTYRLGYSFALVLTHSRVSAVVYIGSAAGFYDFHGSQTPSRWLLRSARFSVFAASAVFTLHSVSRTRSGSPLANSATVASTYLQEVQPQALRRPLHPSSTSSAFDCSLSFSRSLYILPIMREIYKAHMQRC